MPTQQAGVEQETERVRAVQDKQATKYDRQISFFERTLSGDGRAWDCSQARGKVLELACGDTVTCTLGSRKPAVRD